jgi:hypothetical protein
MPNMDIFIAIVGTTGKNTAVNVRVTYSGIRPDHYTANVGYQPKMDRNMPEQTLSMLSKR